MGLGVSIQNTGAHKFYEDNGYIDSGKVAYLDRWYMFDDHLNKIWHEDPCIFMKKKL